MAVRRPLPDQASARATDARNKLKNELMAKQTGTGKKPTRPLPATAAAPARSLERGRPAPVAPAPEETFRAVAPPEVQAAPVAPPIAPAPPPAPVAAPKPAPARDVAPSMPAFAPESRIPPAPMFQPQAPAMKAPAQKADSPAGLNFFPSQQFNNLGAQKDAPAIRKPEAPRISPESSLTKSNVGGLPRG